VPHLEELDAQRTAEDVEVVRSPERQEEERHSQALRIRRLQGGIEGIGAGMAMQLGLPGTRNKGSPQVAAGR
jgi:hypothetical protein